MTAATLIAAHRLVYARWSALLRLFNTFTPPSYPRIEVGFRERPGGEREPIYAYDEEGVDRMFAPYIRTAAGFSDKAAQAWKARWDDARDRFAAAKAEYEAAMIATGAGPAEDAAELAAGVADEAMIALLSYTPVTLEEASQMASYVLAFWSRSEIDKRHLVHFLRAIARAEGEPALKRVA